MKTPRLTIDEGRQEVRINGKEVVLAPKEYGILVELKNMGVTLSRQTLLKTVWNSEDGYDLDTRTVDQHVARLRRKIGPGFIRTKVGYGYQIAAGV